MKNNSIKCEILKMPLFSSKKRRKKEFRLIYICFYNSFDIYPLSHICLLFINVGEREMNNKEEEEYSHSDNNNTTLQFATLSTRNYFFFTFSPMSWKINKAKGRKFYFQNFHESINWRFYQMSFPFVVVNRSLISTELPLPSIYLNYFQVSLMS